MCNKFYCFVFVVQTLISGCEWRIDWSARNPYRHWDKIFVSYALTTRCYATLTRMLLSEKQWSSSPFVCAQLLIEWHRYQEKDSRGEKAFDKKKFLLSINTNVVLPKGLMDGSCYGSATDDDTATENVLWEEEQRTRSKLLACKYGKGRRGFNG